MNGKPAISKQHIVQKCVSSAEYLLKERLKLSLEHLIGMVKSIKRKR
jgi:hypothetical protein